MNRIYISSVLSADLKSRSTVDLLYSYFVNNSCSETNTVVDFTGVNFATRSFIDEFYNVFVRTHKVKIENVPYDIKIMLDTVSRTQNKEKSLPEQENVKSFSSVDDLCAYVSQLAF